MLPGLADPTYQTGCVVLKMRNSLVWKWIGEFMTTLTVTSLKPEPRSLLSTVHMLVQVRGMRAMASSPTAILMVHLRLTSLGTFRHTFTIASTLK